MSAEAWSKGNVCWQHTYTVPNFGTITAEIFYNERLSVYRPRLTFPNNARAEIICDAPKPNVTAHAAYDFDTLEKAERATNERVSLFYRAAEPYA